jgi:hypothetical protein
MADRAAAALLMSVMGALNVQAAGDPKKELLMTIEAAPSGPAGLASADPPALRYGVLYADDKGHSHVQYCDLKNFIFKSYAPPAAPQYVGFPPGEVASIKYAVLPVGYVGTWHTAPGPQWVITLSGRWSVERARAGTRRGGVQRRHGIDAAGGGGPCRAPDPAGRRCAERSAHRLAEAVFRKGPQHQPVPALNA